MSDPVLMLGDCLGLMSFIGDGSVDCIVTDPPYGLSFMGKKWDYDVPSVEIWQECLRVLKPGGTALIFAGSRTQHRMAVNIEDAGFILKDCIMWIYGSGFPKSTDISKQIDKLKRRDYILAAVKLGMVIPGNSLHDWTKAGHSPSDKWWGKFREFLSNEDWDSVEREAIGERTKAESYQYKGNNVYQTDGTKKQVTIDITAPATPAAQLWGGYGTALKPAYEPILVAMKPNDGTYANNALKHGVAGINIDGCRVHSGDSKGGEYTTKRFSPGASVNKNGNWNQEKEYTNTMKPGRFPANIIHDESDEVLNLFPETKSGGGNGKRSELENNCMSGKNYARETTDGQPPSSGSAARFFYCAKASKSERGNGNTHPTVKPLSLMEYLVKLVAPPENGVILDPFLGSGSTGVACRNLNRRFIGIERDPEYFKIAKRRISE